MSSLGRLFLRLRDATQFRPMSNIEQNEKQPANQAEEAAVQESAQAATERISDIQTDVNTQATDVVKPVRKFPRWSDLFSVVGLFVLCNLLASVVLGVVLAANGYEATSSIPENMAWMFVVVQILTFLPVILFVVHLRRRAGLERTGVHFTFRRINAPMILWGILFILVSSIVIEPVLSLLPDVGMDSLDGLMGNGGWSVLSAVVLAPLLEEYLFRGLFIDSMRRRMGTLGAVFVSALLFGLAHGIPQQAFNAFVVGLILGYIYVRTDSLAVVVIIHAINNALAYVLLELLGSSNVLVKDLVNNNTVYYILYGVCLVVFVLTFVKLAVSMRNGDEIGVEDNKTEQ